MIASAALNDLAAWQSVTKLHQPISPAYMVARIFLAPLSGQASGEFQLEGSKRDKY